MIILIREIFAVTEKTKKFNLICNLIKTFPKFDFTNPKISFFYNRTFFGLFMTWFIYSEKNLTVVFGYLLSCVHEIFRLMLEFQEKRKFIAQ